MKRSNRGMWAGIGIGAGLLGLASAGAGLALAYKQAKKQDKTLKEFIITKAKFNNKAKCSCCDGNDAECSCDCHEHKAPIEVIIDDSQQLSIDDVDELLTGMTNEEVDELLDELEEPKDLFDDDVTEISNELDEVKKERDNYKALYEELLKSISVDKKDSKK